MANNPIANPMIVHRVEDDDWAVLFDPDANETYALDPVSSFVWQLLDGKHSKEEILAKLEKECEDGIPEEAATDLDEFLTELEAKALVGYEQAIG